MAFLQGGGNYGGGLNAYLGNLSQLQGQQNFAQGQYLGYTDTETGDTSNVVYFNPYAGELVSPVKAKAVTEFDWLRKRVDEVCWKAA